ncbi:MAG: PIG-L family deacetylase [Treponema sp.]|jgi:LmbE family N-acetylglucosaminyl deacetylase|nr:PIG-L family deacetylase [Treponema sp.]
MNILAIGAHFDDLELGCGGTVARHAAEGNSVYAYVATKSGYKAPDNSTVRSDEIALAEGKAAMNILGAELICGSFPAFEVEFNDELNRQIVQIIQDKNIQRIYTHWIGDTHHDHQVVARASLHACRHVPDVLMYRSNWYDTSVSFHGNFYVDISDYWQKKEDAINVHVSEIKRTGSKWIEYFKREAKNSGLRAGVKYAEVFEVVKWLEK